MEKIIAGKDIHFSNSIVEACNKLLKYRYLFINEIPDFESLLEHLEKFIPIYNYIRPHVSLKGLTPYTAFTGNSSKEFQTSVLNKYFDKKLLEHQDVLASCTICDEV
jgi:hypothetical protein